ncbi:MAG: hypothetical protein ACOX51_04200 [Myxococcota bacterium]|nr:hypothetical protein [Myxococcota bacterium]MBP8971721.1 hypothetical protein [Myxococcota bacterium]HHW97440.1 hypothetical protein [Oligoflexales bacterium]
MVTIIPGTTKPASSQRLADSTIRQGRKRDVQNIVNRDLTDDERHRVRKNRAATTKTRIDSFRTGVSQVHATI